MSFSDIFKKDFLASFTSENISVPHIAAVLLITAAVSVYIFMVYKLVTKKTFYSKNFNISLAAIAVITAGIILAVQSSIVISLGMVGALSIVRFRTAVKDPMDLVFLFWAISIGIICGARLYVIAVIVSIFVTIMVFALDKMPVAKSPKILVVNANGMDAEDEILEVVERLASYYKVKSRSLSSDQLDMVVELRAKEEKKLIQGIHKLESVHAVSLLAHDGEVTF